MMSFFLAIDPPDTDEQIGASGIMVSTAGNDTTEQTTSHTVKAIADNPDRKHRLTEDFNGQITSSIEEFFCLGHSLARTQLPCLFRELLSRTPGIEVGDPVYLESNVIDGISSLPVRV